MSRWKWLIGAGLAFTLICLWAVFLRGTGGYKRYTALTGIYAVCKPGGYPFVVFLEAGHDGMTSQPWDKPCL